MKKMKKSNQVFILGTCILGLGFVIFNLALLSWS